MVKLLIRSRIAFALHKVARPFALHYANRSSSLRVNFGYGNIEFLSNAIKQLA